MNIRRVTLTFAFVMLCTLIFTSVVFASESINCYDDNTLTGYVDRDNCVPGMITNDTWYTPTPNHSMGKAVWYGPYIMEATAEWRSMDLEGFVGGVAMMSPTDIGEVVWLKRPGYDWEGPFLVVDTSQRNHMYTTVTYIKEIVEVDFDTALRWDMVSGNASSYSINAWMIRDVEVWKGIVPPSELDYPLNPPIIYSDWFMDSVTFDNVYTPNEIYDGKVLYGDYNDYLVAFNDRIYATVFHGYTFTPDEIAEINDVFYPDPIEEVVTVTTTDTSSLYNVTWEVDCDDGVIATGYYHLGYCVPGLITYDSWFLRYPRYTYGYSTYYAPGVMDRVVANRGMSLDGYVDGIVLSSCSHIGESVWIRHEGRAWEGPYLVVDCSARQHQWVQMIIANFHMEVDYDRWISWQNDGRGTQYIEVCIGSVSCSGSPVAYWYYWAQRVEFEVPVIVQ